MANLGFIEKEKLENVFSMGEGYVLNFSDSKFFAFFKEININIYDGKYRDYNISGSKANCLRAFWEQESDDVVGKVLVKLIDYAKYTLEQKPRISSVIELKLIGECYTIAYKLLGKTSTRDIAQSKEKFLSAMFDEIQIAKLPIASDSQFIVEERLSEAQVCFKNGAYLATIVMAGSALEAALMGAAKKYSEQFNNSTSRPKSGGKTKRLDKWSLADYINVGADIKLLGEDVKELNHGLRNFRNYIHPLRQTDSKFTPDQHTAEMCLQVLKATFHDLIENKSNE